MSITIQSNPTYSNLFFYKLRYSTRLDTASNRLLKMVNPHHIGFTWVQDISPPATPHPGHLPPTWTVAPHPYKIGMKRHPRIAAPRFRKAPPPPKNVKVMQHENEERGTQKKKKTSALILGASIHPSRSVGGLLFGNAIFHGRANVREGFCP